ncbi:SpaA isopeptide-forming pilin-related protein [Vagococcus silagei]|uniref:Choice-of-anchor A family protein n=1 Tax=Vagococcus silagei TaxID=2508885 RepID=A0A4S3B003_9ENTE|nr:SpaA isopeptide-forming pilin-related protein [Vagococcus silagei]THB60394.1 choice-of-anchor A family protein [Vagococcus silagei]
MKRKNVLYLLVLGLVFMFLPMPVVEASSPNVQDGGNFYQDVPEAQDSYLGAAQYFHIFANRVYPGSHTNGNIATKYLDGNADLGTKNFTEKEYHYIQDFKTIVSGSFPTGPQTKVVFGKNVDVDVSNPNRVFVKNTPLDRLTKNEVFQDNDDEYINFEQEFVKLNQRSQELAAITPDKSYSESDFPDRNNRNIDVSQIDKKDVFIRIDAEILTLETPLYISGLESGYGSNVKNVYLIVDFKHYTAFTAKSQIKLRYVDGSERDNHEATDFSDGTLLWTFINGVNPFEGDIYLDSTWQGTILAPKVNLTGSKNIDGSIIVNTYEGQGETHRWDWHKNKGGVRLIKYGDQDKKTFLEGAVFSLYTTADVLVASNLISDENGVIEVSDLKPGSYYFKEDKAPDGYKISPEKISFTISEHSKQTLEVEAINEKLPENVGRVKLKKVDSSDATKVLPGTEFGLYKKDGTKIDTYTTNSDGVIEVTDLAVGDYYFKELTAPDGYQLSSEKILFTIKANDTQLIELTAKNTKTPVEKGKVQLKKVDSTDATKVLSGAKFELYTESGTKVGTYTTDRDGLIKLSDLEVGKYYFKELTAPNGYQLSSEKIPFTIKENDTQLIELTAKNTITPVEKGKVQLKKVDSTDVTKVLSGAKFELYTESGIKVGTYSTNSEGLIKVSDLEVGKYYFKELTAPDGYQLSSEKLPFTIKENDTQLIELTAKNTKTPVEKGKVQLKKVDSTDSTKVLSGAKFELYTESGTKVGTYTTDRDGLIKVTDLTAGNYYFKEISAPTGYELSVQELKFTITSDSNENISLLAKNTKTPETLGSVELRKIDSIEKSKGLAGAKFDLYHEGQLIKENLETDKDGYLKVVDLKLGNYSFKEVEAPNGYQLSNKELKFTIGINTHQILKLTFENEKKTKQLKSVQLKKVGSDNKNMGLAGAEFSLYLNNQLIKTGLTTNAQGYLKVSDLVPGDYYFIETKAPTGYQLDEKPLHFTISNDENTEITKELVFVNQKTPEFLASVRLKKVDSQDSKKRLSGAVFDLYYQGKIFREGLTTNSEGYLSVDHLEPGDYYFKEIKAPIGYQIDHKLLKFSIFKNQNTLVPLTLTFENTPNKPEEPKEPKEPKKPKKPKKPTYPKKTKELPKTNEKKQIISTLLGLSLITIGYGILLRRK